MPLFYQHTIDEDTKLAVWKIEEPENFFLAKVPLQAHITHPHKRLQHLAGRYLLQYLFPYFPYDQILIADTRKPYLSSEEYHFSISHCGDYAAAIVSRIKRVGIDIEIATDKTLKILHKFLNGDERKAFNIQHSTSNIQLTTILWCAKESMFKWWGYGNVDYRTNLLLQPFKLTDEGNIQATFVKNEITIPLELQYKIFAENLCLCWIAVPD